MITASACCSKGPTRGPEGRAEAGRAGLPEGRRARPGRRLGQPGPRLSEGRAHPRRPGGPREGRRRTKEPAAPWVINWLTGQINDRNGMLDEAIASYESVLATQDPRARSSTSASTTRSSTPWRGALYTRLVRSRSTAPSARDYLRKAIAAYRRTLAIDSENVAAHYGLGLAYQRSGLAEAAAEDGSQRRPRTADPDGTRRSSPPRSPTRRHRAERPPRAIAPTGGRRGPVHRGPAARSSSPGSSRSTRSSSCSAPPGSARPTRSDADGPGPGPGGDAQGAARACSSPTRPPRAGRSRLARAKDPAADQNAQSIVIHSLHRPGARGSIGPVPRSPSARPTPGTRCHGESDDETRR